MTRTVSERGLAGGLFLACLLASVGCTAEPDEQAAQTAAAEPTAAEPVVTQVAAAAEAAPYWVECGEDPETGGKSCTVDKGTFVGWRTYHAFCHVCHAQDAVGSTFAPSLVERMQEIDKARFMDVVANGYTGQIGVMPPWKDNPNISKRYEELYGYLKARADGVLLPGRPKKKKEEAS